MFETKTNFLLVQIAITILKELVESLAQMLLQKHIFSSKVRRWEFKCKFMKEIDPVVPEWCTRDVVCMKDYKLLLELATSFVIFSSYVPCKEMEIWYDYESESYN